MPPLKLPHSPEATATALPQRVARHIIEVDVLVVGGGPAGIGAAIGAADAGAQVLLVERYGFLGGAATASLVLPLMSYHTQTPGPRAAGAETLYPTDHGPGEPTISGVLSRLVQRLLQRGGAIEPSMETGYVVRSTLKCIRRSAWNCWMRLE